MINNLKKSNDRLIKKFKKKELEPIINQNCYHSPEISDEDNKVVVHDLSWRSDTVSKFIEYIEIFNINRLY
jgi:hypothetical protein